MINAIILQICMTALVNGESCPQMLALAELESSFNPAAIGGVGERGLFQIRPNFFGRVPNSVIDQTKQAIKVVRYVKSKCQIDATLQYILCYNVGTTKGRGMLKTKPSPYRLNYIKLTKKWSSWYDQYKNNVEFAAWNTGEFSTKSLANSQTLVQAEAER